MKCVGKNLRIALLAFAAPILIAGGIANAGLTVFTDPGSPTGSGPFTYTYDISISAGDVLSSGSLFRIYDFGGFNSVTNAPASWTSTFALTNSTSPLNVTLSHGDDPTLQNITFTYTGSTITGPTTINGFALSSSVSSTTIKDFIARDASSIAGPAALFIDTVGPVTVPTPEPTVAGLIGIGTFALARRRRSI